MQRRSIGHGFGYREDRLLFAYRLQRMGVADRWIDAVARSWWYSTTVSLYSCFLRCPLFNNWFILSLAERPSARISASFRTIILSYSLDHLASTSVLTLSASNWLGWVLWRCTARPVREENVRWQIWQICDASLAEEVEGWDDLRTDSFRPRLYFIFGSTQRQSKS